MAKRERRPETRQIKASKAWIGVGLSLSLLFAFGVYYLQKVSFTSPSGFGFTSAPGAASWAGAYFKFDHYARPVAADANGDGTDDLLGPFAVEERGELVMRLGVFDGKTWRLLWSAGPFGTEEKAMRKSKLAVAGKRVVLVDYTSHATIFDLSTGNQVKSFALERAAMGVCSPSASGDRVWIWIPELAPHHGFLINVEAGTGEPHGPLEGCAGGVLRTSDSEEDASITGQRQAETKANGPELPRTTRRRSLQSGRDGVVLVSELGTEEPVVAGFDVESAAILWQASLTKLAAPGAQQVGVSLKGEPYPADVADGRFYWYYHAGRSRFAALDIKTGRKLWDTELPEGAGTIAHYTLTPSRIYLVDNRGVGRQVHVLEAATGSLIASVGSPHQPRKYELD